MELSRQIVNQFVEITNHDALKNEATVYGVIVEQNNSFYVKIDGSDEITPVTSTVDIKAGDRVTISLKNHTATVTGNLTDPSASNTKVGNVSMEITEMGVRVNGLTTFTNGLTKGTTSIDGGCIKTGTIDAARLNLTGIPTEESLANTLVNYPTNSSLKKALGEYTTIESLAAGTTIIDGACIQTGLIDAKYLNLSGAITFADLNADTQDMIDGALDAANDAADAIDLASEAIDTVDGWTYGSTTYIDGRMIKTGTVMASELIGGEVTLLDSDEDEAGYIEINAATSASYAVEMHSNKALRLMADDGNVYICSVDRYGDGDAYINMSSYYREIEFGDQYVTVYIGNDEVQTSDLNKKHIVKYGLDKYDSLFDDLKPVSFMFKQNTSGRHHLGLIAQDVEKSMIQNGIDSVEFAPLVKRPKKNEDGKILEGEYDYGLRYGEFISLLIDQVQTLKKRVAELESKAGV